MFSSTLLAYSADAVVLLGPFLKAIDQGTEVSPFPERRQQFLLGKQASGMEDFRALGIDWTSGGITAKPGGVISAVSGDLRSHPIIVVESVFGVGCVLVPITYDPKQHDQIFEIANQLAAATWTEQGAERADRRLDRPIPAPAPGSIQWIHAIRHEHVPSLMRHQEESPSKTSATLVPGIGESTISSTIELRDWTHYLEVYCVHAIGVCFKREIDRQAANLLLAERDADLHTIDQLVDEASDIDHVSSAAAVYWTDWHSRTTAAQVAATDALGSIWGTNKLDESVARSTESIRGSVRRLRQQAVATTTRRLSAALAAVAIASAASLGLDLLTFATDDAGFAFLAVRVALATVFTTFAACAVVWAVSATKSEQHEGS